MSYVQSLYFGWTSLPLAHARPTMFYIPLVNMYKIMYMYVWYVRIPYMHSALFVRDAIFLHIHVLS